MITVGDVIQKLKKLPKSANLHIDVQKDSTWITNGIEPMDTFEVTGFDEQDAYVDLHLEAEGWSSR